jgi:hypothetical protein
MNQSIAFIRKLRADYIRDMLAAMQFRTVFPSAV